MAYVKVIVVIGALWAALGALWAAWMAGYYVGRRSCRGDYDAGYRAGWRACQNHKGTHRNDSSHH